MMRFRATASYALLQAFLWGMYAVLLNFASNFLLANGLNMAGVSIVLGISTAISIAVQLVIGETVSRNPKRRIWKFMLLLGFVMLLGCGAMLVHRVSSLAICGYAVACILMQTFPALVNSIGMDSIENGAPINYGLARGCGSLAFSLLSYVAGLLVHDVDAYRVGILGAIVVSAFIVSTLLFHLHGEREKLQKTSEKAPLPGTGFLKRHKRFAVFLVGSTLLLFNHNLVCNFMLQIMQSKSAGADAHVAQGTANAIGAILELPSMFAFVWLLKLARCDRWVKISCVFFAAKSVFLLLAPTIYWAYCAQTLQIAGFALYSISSVYYADRVAGKGEAVRAQTYLASTTAIGSLLALSSGGFLCQYFGAKTLLAVASIVAALGALIIFLSAEKIPQE